MLRNITNVAQISANATYKILSSWDLAPLSVNPSKPNLQLHTIKRDPGLDFQFRISEEPEYFNICAGYQDQTWCLDVLPHDKETPHLSPFGYHSGQYWKITPSNGPIKLSNQFTGLDFFLDILSGSDENFMSTGQDSVGQYWMLEHVADNVTLPLDAPDVSSGRSREDHPDEDISHAAIIGITVSSTTAAVLLIVGLVLCCMTYRKRMLRRRTYRPSRPAPKISTGMVQTNPQRDSDVNLTCLSPLPSVFSSTITTSAPTPGVHTPNFRHAHELESPLSATGPRSSIYELPSEDMGYRGDSIEEIDLSDTIRARQPPPPPPPPPMEPEKKTATVVSPPQARSQPSSQASARGHARWEEIVPDGNGEIKLDVTTLRPEFYRSLFREEDGAIRRRPDVPGMGNLRGIAYGFGGGGGMAGSVAPGFEGSAASMMAHRTSDGSKKGDTADGGESVTKDPPHRRQDSRSQHPPKYDGPPGAFGADGKPILELPAAELERRILEWGSRSG